MKTEKINIQNIIIIFIVIAICGIIFIYQTQKVGFHEDEVYSIASSVNPKNGLMIAYDYIDSSTTTDVPEWKTKEFVTNYMTLTPNNYLNLVSIYTNQAMDNHPPVFYTLVHFACILFAGQFTKYSVFLVNIIAFIISCFVLKKTLEILKKENLVIPTLIFYGLSMGTISMVIYQRMYMLLNLFIMLYFYYSLKIYKNDFKIDKKMVYTLGTVTILGFLTQYFFSIYAFLIFVMMLIKMKKDNNTGNMKKFFVMHVVYAAIGILLFVPCINHLLFSGRGISNLGNTGYFEHFWKYIQHLAYAFSINTNIIVIIITFAIFFAGIIYLYKKSNDKFTVLLTIVPSVIYFIIAVQMTSFQELRYIMTVIPFIAIVLFMILDEVIKVKYKNTILAVFSVALVTIGIVFSGPRFLYKNYEKCIEIAKENSDKSFVYVYDNFFNHIQSAPEMMIYQKTLIINETRDEMKYVINDEELNKEDSYILCIKSYLNNEEIIDQIKNNTEFKNIQKLYSSEGITEYSKVENELYLVSK